MNMNILKAALFCPGPRGFWGMPILLHGRSGTGKSAIVEAVARLCGLNYYRLAPSERGEGQFGVVPVPFPDGYLHYPPPDFVAGFDASPTLLFVDEIDSVPMAMQAPLLGMVQLRTIGSHTFGRGVRVIGAANGVAGTWDLREDLLNRFGHLEYNGLDAADWAVGLLGRFVNDGGQPVNAAALEAEVMVKWPSADATARGMVAGFISRRTDLLEKRPAKGSGQKAFPTPRTCEDAAITLASAIVHGLSEADTDELMGAFVGQAWVTEFRSWSEHADLPNPADVLDGKVEFAHDARRLDRTLAVLGACAALVVPQDAARRNERGTVLWRLIESVVKDAPDIAVPSATAIVKSGLLLQEARKGALSRLLPVLSAAGVV